MIKKINKTYNNKETNKEELKTVKVMFHKDNVIVETKDALLVDIGEGAVWLTKKGMFDSRYTNILTKFVIEDFSFEIIKSDTNKVIKKVSGTELAKIMN